MKKQPNKLKSEIVKEKIEVSISKTDMFFDIIAEGEEVVLTRVKEILELDTQVFTKGVFGKSLIVMDTCDDFTTAKQIFRDIIWKLNRSYEKWK
jgi:hypothetical protein